MREVYKSYTQLNYKADYLACFTAFKKRRRKKKISEWHDPSCQVVRKLINES